MKSKEMQTKMLRIYIGEEKYWEEKPLYEAIVMKLREMDIAGATVYQGIMGYGANQRLRHSAFLSLSNDLPILITVVDKAEKIDQVIPIINPMVGDGLIVASKVEVIKYSHGEAEIADLSLSPESSI